MSGNTAIVGAKYADGRDLESGSAYVFKKDDSYGNWIQVDKLTASDGATNDQFGNSVSISGNTAIVGAYRDVDKGPYSGSAYVYERDDSSGNWIEVDKLTASDGASFHYFGSSVSISGNTAIVDCWCLWGCICI